MQAADLEKIDRYHIPSEDAVSLTTGVCKLIFMCFCFMNQKPSSRYVEPKDEQEVSDLLILNVLGIVCVWCIV